MALSKTFATGQILTAEDVNTHLVNHVPNPGDPYLDIRPIQFDSGYKSRSETYNPVTIRMGSLVFIQSLQVSGTDGDWSSSAVRFATIHPDHRPPEETRFLAFRTTRADTPFGGYISASTGDVTLQVVGNSLDMGSHFAVVAAPWFVG